MLSENRISKVRTENNHTVFPIFPLFICVGRLGVWVFLVPQIRIYCNNISVRACFVVVSVCNKTSSILILIFVGTCFRTGNNHTLACLFVLARFKRRTFHVPNLMLLLKGLCHGSPVHFV